MYFKNLRQLAFVAIFLFQMPALLKANSSDKSVLDSGSISQQFNYVISKSTQYNEYRAVRSEYLNKLKLHAIDTLHIVKTELGKFRKLSATQAVRIDSLTKGLDETSSKLAITTKEKNSLHLLGIKMPKYQYNAIVFIIILGLITLLVVGFLAFKRKNAIANQYFHDLSNAKEEFEMFRKRALEREQKMARRHLDEILKYKENSYKVGKTRG